MQKIKNSIFVCGKCLFFRGAILRSRSKNGFLQQNPAVSGLFGFVSQYLERRARRQEFKMKTATEEREFRTKTAAAEREFLMKTATDWAFKHLAQGRELSKQGIRVELPALGWLAYDYYQQLGSLMMDGKLPPEVQQAYHAWLRQIPKSPGSVQDDRKL